MGKKTIQIIAGIAVAMLLSAGFGFWLWQAKQTDGKPAAKSQTRQADDAASPSGLNIGQGGSGAASLGQLAPQNKAGDGAGTDNSPNPTLLNPATFADYDKYKDGNQGLYAEIKPGDGAELTPGKQAAVYYKGWLTNGQMFDQSRANSDGSLQPLIFTLGGHNVIPGLEQAVAGMKAGGTRLVIIPPAVGYGSQGQGPIPANAVLVFQIKLLQVQ